MTIVEYWARIRCSRNKAFSVDGNGRRSLVTWSYTFWQESYLLQSQTVVVGTDRYRWHVRFIWWKNVPPSEERCVSGTCATDQAFRRSWTDRGRGPINGASLFSPYWLLVSPHIPCTNEDIFDFITNTKWQTVSEISFKSSFHLKVGVGATRTTCSFAQQMSVGLSFSYWRKCYYWFLIQ